VSARQASVPSQSRRRRHRHTDTVNRKPWTGSCQGWRANLPRSVAATAGARQSGSLSEHEARYQCHFAMLPSMGKFSQAEPSPIPCLVQKCPACAIQLISLTDAAVVGVDAVTIDVAG
jgi:hypothetical protein